MAEQDFKMLSKDVAYDLEKFKDPYVVGAMIHRLTEERKKTNKLLARLEAKFDKMLELVEGSWGARASEKVVEELSNKDLSVLEFVKESKRVGAGDVQKHFKYRGKNAASARLNRLFKTGLLEKYRAGKQVYFKCK